MPLYESKNILTGLLVCDAMRRQVIGISHNGSIDKAVSLIIKYKVNALLVRDTEGVPVGVLSKTDIMTAYYGGIPIDTEVRSVVVASPLSCPETESLDNAMEMMRRNEVYRIYAYAAGPYDITGLLAYPDIVGLLYRFCRNCENNYLLRGTRSGERPIRRFTVREVMTPGVQGFSKNDNLYTLMEGLSQYRFGAVLIRGEGEKPVGVVSKTDLILAYKHGVSPEAKAEEIMSKGIQSCNVNSYLAEAIHQMIFSDVHRIFIYDGKPDNIVGVLSFTDAARVRSGSCRACLTTRIKIGD